MVEDATADLKEENVSNISPFLESANWSSFFFYVRKCIHQVQIQEIQFSQASNPITDVSNRKSGIASTQTQNRESFLLLATQW